MAKTKQLICSVSKVVNVCAIVVASVDGYMTYRKKRKIYVQPIRRITLLGGESGGI